MTRIRRRRGTSPQQPNIEKRSIYESMEWRDGGEEAGRSVVGSEDGHVANVQARCR
jgi:hypothetical protein